MLTDPPFLGGDRACGPGPRNVRRQRERAPAPSASCLRCRRLPVRRFYPHAPGHGSKKQGRTEVHRALSWSAHGFSFDFRSEAALGAGAAVSPPVPLFVATNKGRWYRSRCMSAFFSKAVVREAVRVIFRKAEFADLPLDLRLLPAKFRRSPADLAGTSGWLPCAEPSIWRPCLRGRAAPWRVGKMDRMGGQSGFFVTRDARP